MNRLKYALIIAAFLCTGLVSEAEAPDGSGYDFSKHRSKP